MKTRPMLLCALAALGIATVTSIAPFASASSHREAPAIAHDPAADNTDLYAWVTPGSHDKLNVVACYNPLEEPSGGPNFHKFSDDVLYEIHITRGAGELDDAITYQFRFETASVSYNDPKDLKPTPAGGNEFFSQITGATQTYTVWKKVGDGKAKEIAKGVKVAPPNIGELTDAAAYGIPSGRKYDDAFADSFVFNMGPSEGRVFAGPRDDGFYVDLARVFDLANILDGTVTPKDGVAGYNCHAIAIEIPTSELTGTGKAPTAGASDKQTLGIWASASRRKVTVLRHNGGDEDFGPWIQVSRLGLPLINEVMIGYQDKDKFNRSHPKNDLTNFGSYFLNPILVRDAEFRGFYKALSVDDATVAKLKKDRLDIVELINLKASGHNIPIKPGFTGDVLRVDIGMDSAFPNGRPLIGGAKPNMEQTDVTDVMASFVLTGKPSGVLPAGVMDGVDGNDKDYLTVFPYLALPWQGLRQGHGKPAK